MHTVIHDTSKLLFKVAASLVLVAAAVYISGELLWFQ